MEENLKRSISSSLTGKIGQRVKVAGWVYNIRDHGEIIFLDLRDRGGIVQVVGEKEKVLPLNREDVVEILGKVRKRPEGSINKGLKTGEIELEAEKIRLISKARSLPFEVHKKDLKVKLPTALDFRPLSLRHLKSIAVFKLQAQIVKSFRDYLNKRGFTEIFPPTIVASATEGGAEIFPLSYYGKKAYLSQSPQLYKQIGVSFLERVYTVSHSYRAEPSVTTRHLSEYIGLDVEFGFIESWSELMDLAEGLLRRIFEDLKENAEDELKTFGATIPVLGERIPRVPFLKVKEICKERGKGKGSEEFDLSPEEEREITKWAIEEKGSELVFVTHYPQKKRPFYTFPDPDNPKLTYSFDLIGRGVEWITGGQRINDYDLLVSNIKKWGYKPEDFEIYLQAFRYGMPPEGGFCLGLERITMHILGLSNIRYASLFPRDMQRVDIPIKKMKPFLLKNERKE